jgi:translocator protein
MADWKKLALCIVICQIPGAFGSLFTIMAIPAWYATLNKPFFSPPNWLFAPVWLSLYTLMGISLYLVLEKGRKLHKPIKPAAVVFGVQLALNALWSFIFFGLRSPALGFITIVLLWISIAYSVKEFRAIDKKAAYLLVPYILWVSFAAILNLAIMILN